MRTMTNILVWGTLAAMAMAQAKPAPKSPAAAAPASQTTAKPMPASQKVVANPAKPAPAKAMPAPAKAAPAKAAPMKAAAPAKPAPKAAMNAAAKVPAPVANKPAGSTVARSKRDPFVSPIRIQGAGPGGPACTTGPKCLMVQQVVLKGVVKTQGGMIAMVENAAKKQYNLREKDPVYNGFVLKITSDSIVFRETVTDFLGNASTKEVVKRVTVPAV
jgi:hypothetical protein